MGTEENLTDSSTRLGNCEVCDSKAAKYTCPRCDVRSCSLSCVKIHKNELECNGVRDKTIFKPLNKFSNLDLLSDYRLLEDISRSVIKYHKDVNKKWTRYQKELPIQLYKLKCTAFARGIRLMFLPQNFSRHKENTTYYDWRTKELFWRIEWIFFGLSEKIKFVDERILDTEKLVTAVSKYLTPRNRNPELEHYYSADYNGVLLLLKAEKTSDRFFELDMHLSLKRNLKRKVIIEFPTIHVILKHNKYEYDLIDSDEEMEINSRKTIEKLNSNCDSEELNGTESNDFS